MGQRDGGEEHEKQLPRLIIFLLVKKHILGTNIFIVFIYDFKCLVIKLKAPVTTNYIAVKFPTHTHNFKY